MSRSTPALLQDRRLRSFSTSSSKPLSTNPQLDQGSGQFEKTPSPQYWTTSWKHHFPSQTESEGKYQPRNDRQDYTHHSPTSISDRRGQRGSDFHINPPLPTPPYETQVSLSPGPKSAPTLPSHQNVAPYTRANSVAGLPPSPPWSTGDMSTRSSPRLRSSSVFSQSSAPATPIPGTMHSRDTQSQLAPELKTPTILEDPPAEKPAAVEHKCSKCGKCEPSGGNTNLKSRFTSAFKDFFKRPTIDESKFDRIEGRHWSE